MKRGQLFRVRKPGGGDPKKYRVFVVVSRSSLIESSFGTVICAPIYTNRIGLASQVPVGVEDGLKHDSAIACDSLISMPKQMLTDYVGTLRPGKIMQLNQALKVALALE